MDSVKASKAKGRTITEISDTTRDNGLTISLDPRTSIKVQHLTLNKDKTVNEISKNQVERELTLNQAREKLVAEGLLVNGS